MKTQILEQKLKELLTEKFPKGFDGRVKLGESIRTYEQWNRDGFRISKGQTAIKIKVGDTIRFYFWRTQVWHLKKYQEWKKKQNQFQGAF